MAPQDWIALASVLATVVVATVGLVVTARVRDRQLAREEELREIRREEAPRLQFTLDGTAYPGTGGQQLFALTLTLANRGLVRWQLTSIKLRIRGIAAARPLEFWEGHEPRTEFPVAVIDDAEILPATVNYVFVEPGVEQTMSYVTILPADVEFALVHVRFSYDQHTPHTAERVFHVRERSSSE